MKKSFFIIVCFFCLFLVACQSEYGAKDEMPPLLEVELYVPETGSPSEPVKVEAFVTYGDEKVKDADEVVFEVWAEGDKENSRMIDSTNNGDGTYEAEITFSEEGEYVVQVHVTARNQHNMPTANISIK